MSLTKRFADDAMEDVDAISAYFDQFNETTSDRFWDSLDKTVKMLCEHPELGEVFLIDAVGGIRHRTVADFQNYVVFYRSDETELLVIRVLHGSQDYPNVFNK